MPIVVVTGATGYVACELVRQLVSEGYTVRATVRSKASPKSTELVAAIEKACAGVAGKGSVELWEADLLAEGSFDAVCKGAEYVFHTASPFSIKVSDPKKDLIEPAVNGTRNVMMSCVKTKDTIKRVVVTASVACITDAFRKQVPKAGAGQLYSEEDFNVTSALVGIPEVDGLEGYFMSKSQAEQEAMRICSENGLDLVAILPDLVMGPVLTAASAPTSTSIGFMKDSMEGNIGVHQPGFWALADVRDVGKAHILAATHPDAKGRYLITCGKPVAAKEITDILKKSFPSLSSITDGAAHDIPSWLENTKVTRELGMPLTPVEKSIEDMAKSLIELGIVKV